MQSYWCRLFWPIQKTAQRYRITSLANCSNRDNNQQISAAAIFPFLCRKFLETSLTSILARIDPLRVLSVRKHQKLENYDHGKPNVSSISWTGDILPAEKPPNSSEIWDSASLKGTERSLLGWHIGNAVFDPGLRWIVDNSTTTSDWIRKLGDRENPFAWIKGSIGADHSTLSREFMQNTSRWWGSIWRINKAIGVRQLYVYLPAVCCYACYTVFRTTNPTCSRPNTSCKNWENIQWVKFRKI